MPRAAKRKPESPPAEGWRSRIVGEGDVAPDQLLAHPLNARRHPNAQRDALDASLDTLGWIQRIVVNRRTGHVIDGHARVEQALSRGEATVPVVYVDLDDAEERLALAVYDPISALAVYDEDVLRELLAGVTVDSAALMGVMSGLTKGMPKAGLTDPDAVPPVPTKVYVKRGDVYLLGAYYQCEDCGKVYDYETGRKMAECPCG